MTKLKAPGFLTRIRFCDSASCKANTELSLYKDKFHTVGCVKVSRMESRLVDDQLTVRCFKGFPSLRHRNVKSTGSIPHMATNGPSVDIASSRRVRSSTLPRASKKDKQHTQSFHLSSLFGSKTNQDRTSQTEKTTLKVNGKNTRGTKQNSTFFREHIFAHKTGKPSPEEKQFVIPTICVQSPEEVNVILQLHSIAQTFHKDPPGHSTQSSLISVECMEATQSIQRSPIKGQKNTKRQRKRSASWSGEIFTTHFSDRDSQICANGELKSCMSWSGFLDSETTRETDLCSTDL